MSFDETDVIERLQAVADEFEMPRTALADDVRRGRRRVRRNRGLVAGGAAAAMAVVLGVTAVTGQHGSGSDGLEPIKLPGLIVGDVPVWYDAQGLHHGDIVEQTPVNILRPEKVVDADKGMVSSAFGALALVRSGALYVDPASGDVWFHPWGGDPRVVGHNSAAGPGGDPNGDIAAWFERSELVVYDTAAGSEVSRTSESHRVGACSGMCGDHFPPGNGFLQVSAERVIWFNSRAYAYSHDLRTGATTKVTYPTDRYLLDVQGDVKAWGVGDRGSSSVALTAPGQEERSLDVVATNRIRPVADDNADAVSRRGAHAVGHRVDERIDAGTDILQVHDQDVPLPQHLRGRLARLAVERVDRDPASAIVTVRRLDHVVLDVGSKPVLRAEQRHESYALDIPQPIGGVLEARIYRGGIRDQPDPLAGDEPEVLLEESVDAEGDETAGATRRRG